MTRGTITLQEVTEKAREGMASLTGLKPSSTVGTYQDSQGRHILLEMVEKESIPDSMDILAVYDVLVDEEGAPLEFNRKGMRKRIDCETENLLREMERL